MIYINECYEGQSEPEDIFKSFQNAEDALNLLEDKLSSMQELLFKMAESQVEILLAIKK